LYDYPKLRGMVRYPTYDGFKADYATAVLIWNPNVIRCPYCVEGDNLKIMKTRVDGAWFLCSICGHRVMPKCPDYRCNCPRCELLKLVR
jgi:hypothetical protein